MAFSLQDFRWTREPASFTRSDERIEIITNPHTDLWQRLSRREDDYRMECSTDGLHFSQMRICHMWHGGGRIRFGIYACSPEASSFRAVFTNMELTECKWLAHDGQQPDLPEKTSI